MELKFLAEFQIRTPAPNHPTLSLSYRHVLIRREKNFWKREFIIGSLGNQVYGQGVGRRVGLEVAYGSAHRKLSKWRGW